MKLVTESFTVSILQYILKLLGVVTDPKQEWYTQLYLFYYFCATLAPSIIAEVIVLFTSESFIYKFDSLVYLALTLLVPHELINCYRRRHIFSEIHQIIKSNEYMDDQFYEQCDQKLRKSFFTTAMMIFGLMMMAVLYPIMLTSFTDAEYGTPPTLIYPCSFPWKIDGPLSYACAFAFQGLMSMIPISVFAGIPLYFQYIKIVLESLSDVLVRKIRKMDDLGRKFQRQRGVAAGLGPVGLQKASKELFSPLECEWDEKMLKEMHGIFQYHQFLINFTKKVIFSIQGLAKMVVLTSFVFNALLTSMFILIDGQYIYRLKMLNAQTVACVQIWVLVSLGELIAQMNQRVSYQMYETEWYRQSIRFRKHMILFLGLCNKSLELRLFGTIIFDRFFLSRAASKTFSFIQFILKTQKPPTSGK